VSLLLCFGGSDRFPVRPPRTEESATALSALSGSRNPAVGTTSVYMLLFARSRQWSLLLHVFGAVAACYFVMYVCTQRAAVRSLQSINRIYFSNVFPYEIDAWDPSFFMLNAPPSRPLNGTGCYRLYFYTGCFCGGVR
jgi:hypothetical protein